MSSKAPKTTSTTTEQKFSPQETEARNKLFAAGSTAFDQQNAAINASSNPSAAPVPLNQDQLNAQDMYKNFASGAGANISNNMAGAVDYGLNGAMDVNNNPYLQQAIDAATQATTRNYTDPNGVLANIRSDAVSNGQYGGTRQGLGEGVAAGRYANEIGNIAATMSSDAYNKGQDTFARTLGLAPSAMQAGLMPADAMAAVGQQNQLYGQAMEDYNASGRAYDLNKAFIPVQNYANLINGIQAPGTVAQNSVANNGQSSAMGALGGGLSGAASGAMMGSIFPGVGTAMGAAIGGGLGVLTSLF